MAWPLSPIEVSGGSIEYEVMAGRELAEAEQVLVVEVSDGSVLARIGSGHSQVNVRATVDDSALRVVCSCPASQLVLCRHVVALAVHLAP